MEKLIEKAIKVLKDNYYEFNEITLSDGQNTVHLVRTTPTPYSYQYPYQWQYPYGQQSY